MRFENTDELRGAEFVNVDLSGARFRNVNLEGAKVMEAMLVNARFSGLIHGLVVNDIEVAPLITAEMARRYPERTKWSFLETLRHLIFVTDGWISGTVLGRKGNHHPFGVPPTFITDPGSFGIDTAADPSFGEVLDVREEQMAVVRTLVTEISEDDLQRTCGEHTVLSCLWTLFVEEWHHNWFANRDLDALGTTR